MSLTGVTFYRRERCLDVFGKIYFAENNIRSLANGLRRFHDKNEVVYTEPFDGSAPKPYDPYQFPEGIYKLVEVVRHDDKENDGYLYPYFIRTTQQCLVNICALDENGGYDSILQIKAPDSGCGLHSSTSSTTLGCIRVGPVNDDRMIRQIVEIDFARFLGPWEYREDEKKFVAKLNPPITFEVLEKKA